AVREAANAIASAIEPGAGGGRIRDETLGGEVGPVAIAAGHAGAADVELTLGAVGHGLPALVEDVGGGARDRPADGGQTLGVRVRNDHARRGNDRALGGAVVVHEREGQP